MRMLFKLIFLAFSGLHSVHSARQYDIGDEIPRRETFEDKLTVTKFFAGRYYENAYKTIDDYLTKNVASQEVEANMAKAKEWLELERAKGSSFKKGLVEALEQFTSLTRITETNRCNMNSHIILLKNDLATEHRAREAETIERRVDSIVRHFIMKHAIGCVPYHLKALKALYWQLDTKMLHRVDRFVSSIIESRIGNMGKELRGARGVDFVKFGFSIDWLGRWSDVEATYKVIRELATEEADRTVRFLSNQMDSKTKQVVPVNKDKIKLLFERYVIKPCEYYIRELAELLGHAEYDLLAYQDGPEASELFPKILSNRMCHLLIDQGAFSISRNLIRLASSRTE